MKFYKKNGFNLLIMSVIIMIIGIIFSSTLHLYKINDFKGGVLIDKKNIEIIKLALKNYLFKNKRFPCPALLNCNTETCINENYSIGQEFKDNNNLCIYDNKGVFISSNLLYGTIPTQDLGISNEYIKDFYGNKIIYIIPKKLTEFNYYLNNIDDITEYVIDDKIYLFILSKNNSLGRYSYNNLYPSYFNKNNKIDMPIENFEIQLSANFTYFYETNKNFNLYNLKEFLKECPEYTYISNIDLNDGTRAIFTFKKAKYGELVFSNEMCPNLVSNYAQSDNYFYLSTYIFNNRMAKKCSLNGKWEENFIYECNKLEYCPKPSEVNNTYNWTNYNYNIVNNGMVIDDENNLK